MGRLDEKVALVSGAARGQGEAIARKFAAEGAKVVLGDVLDDLGRRVAGEIGAPATYLRLDVTQPEDWQTAVRAATETYGKLNVLINNAGIVRFTPFEKIAIDEYLAVIGVNQV